MRTGLLRDIGLRVACVLFCMLIFGSTGLTAQPANDEFDNATIVNDPLPFTDFVNTEDATTAFDDPDCAGQGPTVWYAYTPETDIAVEVNTFGSDYDTALSVYLGTRGNLIQIACNDDAGSLQSRVRFDAVAEETYYFMAGAFGSGPGGQLQITVQEAPPPGPPLTLDLVVDPSGTFHQSGSATLTGVVTCSKPVPVSIFGDLKQEVGRFAIIGFVDAFVFCDGTTPWEAAVISDIGDYRGGKVKIVLSAFAFDPETDEFASDFEAIAAQLRGGGRRSSAQSQVVGETDAQAMQSNYPNPFNPRTTVRFSLKEASQTRLTVYDLRGRQVRVLIDGMLPAGEHEAAFEAADLPSGVYYSRLEVDGKTSTTRMVLVK